MCSTLRRERGWLAVPTDGPPHSFVLILMRAMMLGCDRPAEEFLLTSWPGRPTNAEEQHGRRMPEQPPDVSRHQRGVSKLQEYTLPESGGVPTHLKIAEDLNDIAPDVGKYIVDFGYGELYCRPGLTNQQRALITIASLVTQGTERQLELHVNTGLTAGLTSTEIVESIIHLIGYTGFPRVLNALYVVKKVFEQRQVEISPHEAE